MKCGCKALANNNEFIVFCPLHVAADELYEALDEMRDYQHYEHVCEDENYPPEDRIHCAPCKMEKVLLKAKQERTPDEPQK